MFVCSFCGNEHEDDREFCPETGDKIELCKCINAECGKIIDTHFSDCPYCGTFQFDREAYLQRRSAELYEEAVNFLKLSIRGFTLMIGKIQRNPYTLMQLLVGIRKSCVIHVCA